MYRILLVDDETDVRESIARMIDWDTQGFSLCGCAAGSLEALEMADELLPDVVMTDICMPYIDGLELIRRLRKVHPAMQFVIVSGYDDFSYAQQAVQLHVMDYLLKPLSRSGVEAVLQRVRARLDAETLRRRDVEELRTCAKRDQLQLQRMALIESITDDSPNLPADGPGSLAEFLPGRLGVVELLSGQEQEAALVKDFGGNPGLMELSVRQIAQELTETGDIPGLCAPHRKRLVLLLPLDADSAVSACERLMDTVRMYLHLPMRAAVSAPVNEISQLSLLYQRTLLLTGSAAPFAIGSVFLMEEHPSGSSAGPSAPLDEVFGQISALVRSGDAEKTPAAISAIWARRCQHTKTTPQLRRRCVPWWKPPCSPPGCARDFRSIGCSRSSANIRCQRMRRFPRCCPYCSAPRWKPPAPSPPTGMKPISPLHNSCGTILPHIFPTRSFPSACCATYSASARRSSRSCSAGIWARPFCNMCWICASTGRGTCCCTATKRSMKSRWKPALRTPAIFPTASASAAA